jgi:tetratricopeptide (TPR) repeat protein
MSADARIRALIDQVEQFSEDAKPRERAQALVKLGIEYSYAGLVKNALESVRRALDIAGRHNFFEEQAEAYAAAALCHQFRWDFLSAVAAALDAYRGFSLSKNYRRMGHTLTTVGWACREIRAYALAETVLRASTLIGVKTGDKFLESRSCNILGLTFSDCDRFDEAQTQFELARQRLIDTGQIEHVSRVTSNMGNILRRRGNVARDAGDVAGALVQYQQARELANKSLEAAFLDENAYEIADKKCALAEFHLLVDDVDAAFNTAEEARDASILLKSPKTVVESEIILGRVFALRANYTSAELHFRSACERARLAELRALQQSAHTCLASTYRSMGRQLDAHSHEVTAHELKLAIDHDNDEAQREVKMMWEGYFSQHPLLLA